MNIINKKINILIILLIMGVFITNCSKRVNPDSLNMTYLTNQSSVIEDSNAIAEEKLQALTARSNELMNQLSTLKEEKDKQKVMNELREIYEQIGYIKGKSSIETVYEEQAEKISKLLENEPTPLKMPDTIVRVLFLPYVDQDRVLHAQSYKFLKIDEGKWVLGEYMLKPGESIREVTPLDKKAVN